MPYPQTSFEDIEEMWTLVVLQHKKCLESLSSFDHDLAREVLLIEERISSCEQFVEARCKRYLANHSATEPGLSTALFALKTAKQLASAGDMGKKMAEEILRSGVHEKHFTDGTLLFDAHKSSNKILELTCEAFTNNDVSVLPLIFARINLCREMIGDAKDELHASRRVSKAHVRLILQLFSIAENLEQTLDLSERLTASLEKQLQSPAISH